jgi:hypothetical protein
MSCYRVRPKAAPLESLGRDTIGGRPILARGQIWPRCLSCSARMTFFFQLDLPRDLELFGGHHLVAFHCTNHDHSWLPPDIERLPTRFWEGTAANGPSFWQFLVNRPGPEQVGEPEPRLAPASLAVTPMTDAAPDGRGLQLFKIGGTPSWAQDAERYRCACGAHMHYLCQVPEGFEFDGDAGPYQLFAGSEVYLHHCGNRCDPRAVWPVCQS